MAVSLKRLYTKAANIFSRYSSSGSMMAMTWGRVPGSDLPNAELAGPLHLNSTVAIALGFISRNFCEPVMEVQEQAPDGWQPIPDHPLPLLLDTPNDAYGGADLWASTALDLWTGGNAYWLKIRDGYGKPVELWQLSAWQTEPRARGSEYIGFYRYHVDGKVTDYPVEDILHFRFGYSLDPYNPRLTLSPLGSLLRQVCSVNEAGTYVYALLRNTGVIPYMLSPADPTVKITKESSDALREQIRSRYTRDGRGQFLVPTVPMKADKLGLSPEEMALDKLYNVPVSEICSALGVHPMILGLAPGDQQRTYSNYGEAVKGFYNETLLPVQTKVADLLSRRLLPEMDATVRRKCAWNYEDVRALEPDRDKVFTRASVAWKAGWLKRSEARAEAGYEYDETLDDVYSTDVQQANQADLIGLQADLQPQDRNANGDGAGKNPD